MIYALDTEFYENGKTIDLISLAIVPESGPREFYVQNLDAKFVLASPWVHEHVLPFLQACPAGNIVQHWRRGCHFNLCPWLPYRKIAEAIKGFLAYDSAPIFWGYYSSYDWVALCQVFGTMMDLPAGWPMYCRDLRQWLDMRGYSDVRQPDTTRHHALDDAQWIMATMRERGVVG